jgi:hypothetical protein
MLNKDELILDKESNKRTGKEIKIKGEELGNNCVNCKIGASFDKDKPETIYIIMSFWIDIKEKCDYNDKHSYIDYDYEISRKLSKQLSNIYRKDLKSILESNDVFPYYLENIYTFDFPENINYNNKRSFVSLELNLHTLNCETKDKNYPLNNKKDNLIYAEAINVCKKIANSELLKGNLDFSVHKKKKD